MQESVVGRDEIPQSIALNKHMATFPMICIERVQEAVAVLRQGGLIAYPTEAVYGLGCDPFNRPAVEKLCKIKQRSVDQGLVLIAADFQQIANLIAPLPEAVIKSVLSSWPGPYTWVIPSAEIVPRWIRGMHPSIALRVTAHPLAAVLCRVFGGALVSTSANPHGMAPAKNAADVAAMFGAELDLILEGQLGGLAQPTPIRDAMTGAVIRG